MDFLHVQHTLVEQLRDSFVPTGVPQRDVERGQAVVVLEADLAFRHAKTKHNQVGIRHHTCPVQGSPAFVALSIDVSVRESSQHVGVAQAHPRTAFVLHDGSDEFCSAVLIASVPVDGSPGRSEGSELREAEQIQAEPRWVIAEFDGCYTQLVVKPGIHDDNADLEVMKCGSRRDLAVSRMLEALDEFQDDVPRAMSLIRYLDTAGGHGDLIVEGPPMDKVDEGAMTGRVGVAFTAEAGEESLLAWLEDSQFAIRTNSWGAILTVEGAVAGAGAADGQTGGSADHLLLLTTFCNSYS